MEEASQENYRNSDGESSACVSVEIDRGVASNENEDQSGIATSSSDAMARCLSVTLSSLIRDFNSQAESTLKSQDQVAFSIDRLTRELDQLLEDAPLPFIMQHAARISGVRKRVSSLNLLIKSIQRRVDNIDRMLSAGIAHEKAEKTALESS